MGLNLCNCPGCRFARPEIANSTYTKKEFNPMDFVHGRGKWEEPAWDHARFARVIPVGKKQQVSALQPAGADLLFLLGRNGLDGASVASPDPLLLAPGPFSWLTAYKTRHNLGSYDFLAWLYQI